MALLANMLTFINNINNLILDGMFPPKCIICKQIISQNGGLCAECWNKIEFHCQPACDICSFPFQYDLHPGAICPSCIGTRPFYNKAYIVFKFSDDSKIIIHQLKYHDGAYLAPYLAEWIARSAKEAFLDANLIIPVPMHKKRLLKRLYNQAELLGIYLSKITKIPIDPRILLRVKNTISQTGLSKKARIANIKHAFKVNNSLLNKIYGKKILLLDDVITSGSTVNACAELLLKAGAQKVDVIALAKTII